MSQINIKLTPAFNPIPTGSLGIGFDNLGNLCRVNSDGSKTIIPIYSPEEEQPMVNLVPSLGVGLEGDLPITFIAGDQYVTSDTLKLYTAQDAISWGSIDLIIGQFVTVSPVVYQYDGVSLFNLNSGASQIGYTWPESTSGVIVVGTIADDVIEITGVLKTGVIRAKFQLTITHNDVIPEMDFVLIPFRIEFITLFPSIAFNGSNIELSYSVGAIGGDLNIKGTIVKFNI